MKKLLLLLPVLAHLSAHADVTSDWIDGKQFHPVPKIEGAAQQFKFGHPSPPTSPVPPVWRAGLEQVALSTGGRVTFKEYGGGTLLGPRDGFKAVRSGVAEWAACFIQFEGRATSMSRVFELPLVSPTNPMATVRIAQELAPKYFVPEFAKQGVVWGGGGYFLPSNIMSRKPVRKIDDLKGLKIASQGFLPEAARALGMTLVNIPFTDFYTALQQGLIDAVIWMDPGFSAYKLYEVVKFHTTLNLSGGSTNHCYNGQWFASLPPAAQQAFYAAQEPMGMAISKVTQIDLKASAVETFKKNGVEMIVLPGAETAILKARVAPVVANWADSMEKDGKPAKALLADIERLTAIYNPMSADELMKLAIEKPVQGIK